MTQDRKLQQGFSFAEIIIVMAVVLTLFGFIVINLLGAQQRLSLNSVTESFVSDLKSQQLKAMVGSTDGRATTDSYGVYIQQHSYTLFHGSSYSSGDAANALVQLDSSTQFSTTFPSSVVIFQQGSGEINGFSATTNTITITDLTNNQQKTITLNKYGAIVSVQ